MTMMFRDLPKDLVEEVILCHVPATYLKRLESTCKQWHRLFNRDSRFAKKHTDKAAKQILLLLQKEYRICPTIVNLHGSVELKSELSLVDSQSMYSAQFDIDIVFYCDGLLLCASEDTSRFVVWNPFNGETRWFQCSKPGLRHFLLGYYQKDNNKSYKILRFDHRVPKHYEIYEFNSDSWRTRDDIITLGVICDPVSLKGNAYWLNEKGGGNNISLLKYDFQTEKFVPLPLPYQCRLVESIGLSAVREEKLSMLLQRDVTSKTEIWVTNKIDETTTQQVVSWSKVLALNLSPDLQICDSVNFFLDEEKKVVMMCVTWVYSEDDNDAIVVGKHMLYTVGEDDEVTQVQLGTDDQFGALILNYVPSLVQIEQDGRKRKKGDL